MELMKLPSLCLQSEQVIRGEQGNAKSKESYDALCFISLCSFNTAEGLAMQQLAPWPGMRSIARMTPFLPCPGASLWGACMGVAVRAGSPPCRA